jgi:hypothetical protein
MRFLVLALLAALSSLPVKADPFAFVAPKAEPDVFATLFGPLCKGDPCIINGALGGNVEKHQQAAKAVRAGAKQLIMVTGPCYSACAIFLDEARERACITPRASFHFHKAMEYNEKIVAGKTTKIPLKYFDPPHSNDIRKWVHARGGFPLTDLTKKMLPLVWPETKQFWSVCPGSETEEVAKGPEIRLPSQPLDLLQFIRI